MIQYILDFGTNLWGKKSDSTSTEADNFDYIDQVEERGDTQQYEPEPYDDVDLFVDHIDRKNTETVMALDSSRRAKLAEGTLRGLNSGQI